MFKLFMFKAFVIVLKENVHLLWILHCTPNNCTLDILHVISFFVLCKMESSVSFL